MKNKFILLVALLTLVSCSNQPSQTTSQDQISSEIISEIISESSDLIPPSSEVVSSSEQVPSTSEVIPPSSAPVSETNEYGGYYANIDLNAEGTTLLNALKALVNTGFRSGTYSGAWTTLKEADQDVANSSNIIQIYSRYTRPKSEQNSGSGDDNWNREHVVTQSAMGCNTSTNGPCTDYNNLFASDTKVNSTRGNIKFGVVTGGSVVRDSKNRETPARIGNSKFDPGSEARGEVARATLYMIIKWNFSTSINGDLNTLLQWNRDYPPTQPREIKRNNAVQKYQSNRNPFIDYPYLADAIWA